jgi:hypothetical protein
MIGRTDFITDAPWADIMLVWYCLVDDAYQALERRHGRWRRRGPPPVFSDSEVITVALVIDTFFGGHEALGLAFVRQYHRDLFPQLPSQGHFNERRTLLGPLIDPLRCEVSQGEGLLAPHDPLRLLDSAPIFVNTYARGSQSKTLVGKEYFGVASSHGAKVFGLRLVMTTRVEQVIDRWGLVPAAPHDSTHTASILAEAEGLTVLADNAFHAPAIESVLQERHGITLYTPPPKDSRSPWPQPFRHLVCRLRRNIESAFSILTTVFAVEQPKARCWHGLVARLSTRILAYTLCFVTDKYLAQLVHETQN